MAQSKTYSFEVEKNEGKENVNKYVYIVCEYSIFSIQVERSKQFCSFLNILIPER